MQTVEAEYQKTSGHQYKTEEDEDAAEVGHGRNRLSCSQQGGSFAEELRWLAWLGHDAQGARQFIRLLTNAFEIGVKRGQHNDATLRKFLGYVADECKSIPARHGDIAKQKIGHELARLLKGLIGIVGGPGIKTTLLEDEGERVCDQSVIVNDKDSLHLRLPSIRF